MMTRKDYIATAEILNYVSDKTHPAVFSKMVIDFAEMFAKDNGRLTFGSIDQLKSARIKVGTPYKLIFTPKTPLANTAGLFYFVLSDAIDATGKKIELIVE